MRFGAVLLVGVVLCPEAQGTTTLERAGLWEAYVATSPEGTTLCGISQFSEPYALMLKYQPGASFIHLRKSTWNVPRWARMTVSFSIDGRHVWTGRFTGTSDARMIEGDFNTLAQALDFVRAFAWGQRMAIRFVEGTEAPWVADLTGTLRVSRAFLACVVALEERRNPTQPYGRAPPSDPQPFGQPGGQPRPSGRGM